MTATEALRRMTAKIPRNIERKNDPAATTPEQKLELEIKTIKTSILDAIKTKADAETVVAMQRQLDALDVKLAERHASAGPDETLDQFLDKDEGLKRFMHDKNGSHVVNFDAKQTRQIMQRKTAVDSATVGYSTTGVLQIERAPRIVEEARQRLMVRDLLTSRPTTFQVIDFVKVNAPMVIASPQIETHTKRENAVTFTTASARVRTLATWIPAAKQILDDMGELLGFLKSSLGYYVDLAEEKQMLIGSGSGEDLTGLITQATTFDTALLPLSGTYNRIDVIGRVIQQITSASELQPTFLVINPVDWWSLRLLKNANGDYILGPPMGPVVQDQLFGLIPVITTSIAVGTFLVGSGSPIASEIRDRLGMTIEIATQHEDYFARNLVAIRAEKRVALVVYRPASFIRGSFVTSP